MIKSVFVDPLNTHGIKNCGANHLIITLDGLTSQIWNSLKSARMTLTISLVAFDDGGCPANPKAQNKLIAKVIKALSFNPAEIWLDHFRFDGHWEAIEEDGRIPGIHPACQWCRGKIRVEVLSEIANKIIVYISNRSKVGYFAVPFKDIEDIQNQGVLGKIFDMNSPMLYHRMIKKPVSYISDYVSWMHRQTGKAVLPIIQIKDMPDKLKDQLTPAEITDAFNEAVKKPSAGCSFFCWTHVLETNKTPLIQHLLKSPSWSKAPVKL